MTLNQLTDANGRFDVPSIGSGTWAIAYFTCAEGDGPDVSPVVTDSATGAQ